MESCEEEDVSGFKGLGVSEMLCTALAARGIERPIGIQGPVIETIASGRNILFSSATGTGKTFAYLLPMLQNILEMEARPARPLLLICAPTYELCAQIKKEADFLLSGRGIKVELLIGQANLSRQIEGLKKTKPLVLVGNPGRLLQLLSMKKLKLEALRFLVFDEGDRLVSDEIFEDTRRLVELCPEARVSAACSAAMTVKSRERLLPLLGPDPVVNIAPGREVLREQIEHWAFFCEGRKKTDFLRAFLLAAKPMRALVFLDDPGRIGRILSRLQGHRVAAAALHGGLSRAARKKSLDDFRKGSVQTLLTSDLAARGLDIAGVSHVVALDTPESPEAYIHRAGRTARAGRRGIMTTIGDQTELSRLAAIEKRLGIVIYPKALYGGKILAADA